MLRGLGCNIRGETVVGILDFYVYDLEIALFGLEWSMSSVIRYFISTITLLIRMWNITDSRHLWTCHV